MSFFYSWFGVYSLWNSSVWKNIWRAGWPVTHPSQMWEMWWEGGGVAKYENMHKNTCNFKVECENTHEIYMKMYWNRQNHTVKTHTAAHTHTLTAVHRWLLRTRQKAAYFRSCQPRPSGIHTHLCLPIVVRTFIVLTILVSQPQSLTITTYVPLCLVWYCCIELFCYLSRWVPLSSLRVPYRDRIESRGKTASHEKVCQTRGGTLLLVG